MANLFNMYWLFFPSVWHSGLIERQQWFGFFFAFVFLNGPGMQDAGVTHFFQFSINGHRRGGSFFGYIAPHSDGLLIKEPCPLFEGDVS